MSRIGNKIITLPEGVSVTVAEGNTVTVTGPFESFSYSFRTFQHHAINLTLLFYHKNVKLSMFFCI